MTPFSPSPLFFPEELLERILALCLAPSPLPPRRPAWHVPTPRTKPAPLRPSNRIAPLLVSKSWLRIATPLVYSFLCIRSPAQAALLSRTFLENPTLASSTRHLVVLGVWPELAPIASACLALQILDVTLDAGAAVDAEAALETVAFCDALVSLDIRHLTVRRANVYLSQPKPRHIIAGLATAIACWNNLMTAHIDFCLSDDTTSTGALLMYSLANAPKLHTLFTQLPAVWNPTLLYISSNPRLERIVLNPPPSGLITAKSGTVGGVIGTGLFLMEARKWTRLSELIRMGTNIIRTRAHTVGTVIQPPPALYGGNVERGGGGEEEKRWGH